ncbi:MAG: PD-(D/E)XK nuclease family protein [Clostridia bacterium]|nr:PD-(D/E)XK nuclease family protein [Clostridia bacterium]
MLHLIYGRAGSGKSTLLLQKLKETADRGDPCLLLVPEQQVLVSERTVCELDVSAVLAEVTSFRRLCNEIFRTYGGLCYRYIGKGARKLLCRKALLQLAPLLSFGDKGATDDPGRVEQFASAITEMTLYNLTPARLSEVAPSLSGALRKKVEDLAAVATLYQHMLHHEYDDPAEDLTRAADLLAGNDYFAGKTVFIDSFSGYTPQQADLLRHLFAGSKDVYLTIPCLPGGDGWLFEKPAAAERYVLSVAESAGCPTVREAVLEGCPRAKSPDLAYLATHLWGAHETPPPAEAIELYECADLFEEADAAAARVAKLVREGARYGEIAVIARSADRYDGILDSALERYGIPYYTSRRRDIATMPEIRLVSAALAVAAHDFQTEDVIAYLRTYLTDLTPDECDPVEEYAYLWKIRGRRWRDGMEWNMNPRGYADEFTDEDQKTLDRLNALRARFVPPLVTFCESFEHRPTVRSVSEALYRFLCDLQIPDKLEASAEENRRRGDRALADTQTQVWNCLMDALDQLVCISGDEPADPTLYWRLLSLLLKESDIGTIPSGQDQVIIGSANLLRGSGIRHAVILGVCEGVFPARDGGGGYFDDRERAELAENQLTLAEGGEALIHDELYYFYTAVCFPSSSLAVSYTAAEGASLAVRELRELFPDLAPVQPSLWSAEEWVATRESALFYGLTHRADPVGAMLLDGLREETAAEGRIRAAEEGVTVERCRLSPALMERIVPRRLELSPSRLERYVNCPFSYLCSYVLRLQEPLSGEFRSNDVGTFIHKLLETLVPRIAADAASYSDEALDAMVAEEIEGYRRRLLRDWQDPRLERLFERSRPFANLLLKRFREEFSRVQFRPVASEVQIGFGGVPAMQIPLEDGGSVSVRGIVDRVDCCELDGEYYLRVVDYKTYNKTFSRDEVAKGLDTQMLLYLYSLCESRNGELMEKMGIPEGKTPQPAGILYLNVGVTGIPADAADTPEKGTANYFGTSGLLLEDDDLALIRAMEPDLDGRYTPIGLNKYGKLRAESVRALTDAEGFADLRGELSDVIGRIGRDIRGGVADAEPLSDKDHDGCQYCKMRPLCRRRKE